MTDDRPELPPTVKKKLEETFLRIQNGAAAERLYEMMDKSEKAFIDEREEELFGEAAHPLFGKTIGMWMQLRGVSQIRAIIEVGYRLNFITDAEREWLLRESSETFEDAFAAAKTQDLVLDEKDRTIYWKGQQVDVNWFSRAKLWNFLWLVVEHAKSGDGVDACDFGEVGRNYAAKMASRLRREVPGFPPDLAACIVSESRKTRLSIAPERIRLFQTSSTDSLKEVLGGTPKTSA
ncbi:hypothetical protein [Lignipirellula cremea]|uniref:Uncharacterized protein n=1 Tax=Lignipirellula cremea TaxID=2528010 RepID=A0A518DRJ5_9BACT|nr:hypothetical protein [Lignipirellula cremea]QDU94468.1 hypothetical protein Pla8534_22590 [Lignipirellula cremea]